MHRARRRWEAAWKQAVCDWYSINPVGLRLDPSTCNFQQLVIKTLTWSWRPGHGSFNELELMIAKPVPKRHFCSSQIQTP
jgi:hypothetical protein